MENHLIPLFGGNWGCPPPGLLYQNNVLNQWVSSQKNLRETMLFASFRWSTQWFEMEKMEKTHWPSHPSPSRFHWICSVECRLNLWRGSAFDTFGPPSSRSWSPLSAPKGSRNKEKIGNSKVHHVIFHSGYIIQKWHRIRIQHDIVYIYVNIIG